MSGPGVCHCERGSPILQRRGGPERLPRAVGSQMTDTVHDITIYRADWVLPAAAPVQPDGGVAVGTDGRILAVGPAPRLVAEYPAAAIVDMGGSRSSCPGSSTATATSSTRAPRHPRRRRVRGWIIKPRRRQGDRLTPEEHLISARLGRPGGDPPASPPSRTRATPRRRRGRRLGAPACAAASPRGLPGRRSARFRPSNHGRRGAPLDDAQAAVRHVRHRPRAVRAGTSPRAASTRP